MGTKFAEDVKGVRSDMKKNSKPTEVVPTCPARLHMTYKQAVEHKAKLRAAKKAADDAAKAVMSKTMPDDVSDEDVDIAVGRAENLAEKDELVGQLESLRESLAEAEAELEAEPTKRGVKAKITNRGKAIDAIEKKIEKLEV